MTYITRDDGQRFVIPSYRDVLSVKKTGLLQKEIRLVASNYGEYIAIQRKSPTQYEVAFSPEPGLLLGETVWSYFKRPRDLIYCEEIENSNEAILVIVKSGSVYLDGKFPIDSISDELLVFQTQSNQFDIYLYGNVPISKTIEEGKFSFDPSSVKSFNVLDKPLFPRLTVVPQFELKLVDDALKNQGIGVFPIKSVVFVIAIVALIWAAWNYFASYKEVLPMSIVNVTDPYQPYVNELTSPSPYLEIQNIQHDIIRLYSIPGWAPASMSYEGAILEASVKSLGARTNTLYAWAKHNGATVSVKTDGFYVVYNPYVLLDRQRPDKIYNIGSIIANLTDKLSYVLPGNNLLIGSSTNKGKYLKTNILINFNKIVPTTLGLIGQQLKGLPLVLTSLTMTVSDEGLSGSIALTVLGN
jgi:hypothetical protein